VECHGDEPLLIFHNTLLFSLLVLLLYVSKFNIHDPLITLPLRFILPYEVSLSLLHCTTVQFNYNERAAYNLERRKIITHAHFSMSVSIVDDDE